MATTNDFFNNLTETQNKLMESWLETSKKFQSSMTGENPLKKGTEAYNEWLENQKKMLNDMLSANGNGKSSATPEMFKEWMQFQNEIGKSWLSYMQQFSNMNVSNSPEDFLKETRKVYESWNGIYTNWYEKFGKNFTDMRNSLPGMLPKDLFDGMFNSSKAYLKMQEFWAPMMEMIKDGKMNAENMQKMIDPSKFREVVESSFDFIQPDKFQAMYQQMNKYLQMFYESGKSYGNTMKEQMATMQNAMPEFMKADSNNLMQMSMEFSKQFQKMYSPFHKMMPPSKEKEMMENVLKLQEKYAQYWKSTSGVQQLIIKVSQNAMEELIDEAVKTNNAGMEMPDFNKFFNQWTALVEEKMIKAFSTNEFSKAQGDMLSLGLEIKKMINEQMEYALSPYPVVSKSEFDELLASVQELKRKVRALEKQSDISEVETKSTTKKPTSKAKA